MCGIVGVIGADEECEQLKPLIKRMLRRLVHRGPDDMGVIVDRNVGLGHRRLSIIDLSERGRQPMANEDKSIWLVCNGEIYNFKSIRKKLQNLGHIFYSNSDSEVIIHAYEEYGLSSLDYLHGMFAFGLWDKRKNKLLLARDRVGKKPLYYAQLSNGLIFASEIKAIIEHPQVNREINLQALDEYLTFGYISPPNTILTDVKSLLPAHFITLEVKKLTCNKYWEPIPSDFSSNNEYHTVESELDKVLTESVKRRLESDVPLGALMSGGIDSSLVVALMCKLTDKKVKTFSIGFRNEKFNELPFARKVAAYLKTEHHEFTVTPNLVKVLPHLIWHYDQPYGDSSAIPTYYLANTISQHVKVALSGDGGDELFGGYTRYIDHTKFTRYNWLYSHFGWLARFMVDWASVNGSGSMIDRISSGIAVRLAEPILRNYLWINPFSKHSRKQLYNRETLKKLDIDKCLNEYEKSFSLILDKNETQRILAWDFFHYLPHDLLVKTDIASMANSLEVRCPILDHDVANFAFGLDMKYKIRENEGKYILRRLAFKYVPKEILDRPKKGFSIPLNEWLRTDLRGLLQEVLFGKGWEGQRYFCQSYIERLFRLHLGGKDLGGHLWLILCFLMWHKIFMEGVSAEHLSNKIEDLVVR